MSNTKDAEFAGGVAVASTVALVGTTSSTVAGAVSSIGAASTVAHVGLAVGATLGGILSAPVLAVVAGVAGGYAIYRAIEES